MSQRNSETEGMAMGLALVGVAFALLFALIYAVACFVAIILTILALCAWYQPLTIGKLTVTPEEARIFLGCGLAGLVGLPVFVMFCAALFHFQVRPDAWGYILLGGYSFGGLTLGAMIFGREEKQDAAAFLITDQAEPEQTTPRSLPAPQAEQPFRFASWDDEAGR